jgi:GTP-binding protein
MSAEAFTSAETETGRKLFAAEWRFLSAASSLESLPSATGVEIAFAGRSNVGKSSLINALTNRNGLARTSNTPGRTQELIFFAGSGPLTLVDMPGYGYAAAPKAKVAAWSALIRAYLRGRTNLARVYVLVDARHGLKSADAEMLDLLDEAAVSYEIVLTKGDDTKASALSATIDAVAAAVRKRPAAYPDVLVTSARTGAGLSELRAAVVRLLAEKARAEKSP